MDITSLSLVVTLYVCPRRKRAVAWGLRKMGSAWGSEVREGLAHQKAGKIHSQCPTNAEIT
jgi:hypothetical protein